MISQHLLHHQHSTGGSYYAFSESWRSLPPLSGGKRRGGGLYAQSGRGDAEEGDTQFFLSRQLACSHWEHSCKRPPVVDPAHCRSCSSCDDFREGSRLVVLIFKLRRGHLDHDVAMRPASVPWASERASGRSSLDTSTPGVAVQCPAGFVGASGRRRPRRRGLPLRGSSPALRTPSAGCVAVGWQPIGWEWAYGGG